MVAALEPRTDDDPKRYVAKVVRASGSSFARPMLVLPRAKRESMLALYAFCRETDDVVDEIEDPEEALRQLDAWRAELDALYRGVPSHPVTRALAGPVAALDLPKRYFTEILNGFDMDRSGAMCRPDMETLERYCFCVASCVGLISVEIFGYQDRRIPEFAEQLGHAFQLTNILRDIEEDTRRGRIYLPIELLQRHGLAELPPEELLAAAALPEVCAELGALARRRFAAAATALAPSEIRSMRPALLMRAIYETYLDRMEASGWRLSGDEVRLGRASKLWLLLRAFITTI